MKSSLGFQESEQSPDVAGGDGVRVLQYEPRPSWISYEGFLEFTRAVRRDLHDMRPRDMIDIQSFMWVLGSEEYKE